MSSPTPSETAVPRERERFIGLLALGVAGASIVAVAALALAALNDRLSLQAIESQARAVYWTQRLAELDRLQASPRQLAQRGDRMFQRAGGEAQKLCRGRRPEPRDYVACLLVEADVAASRK